MGVVHEPDRLGRPQLLAQLAMRNPLDEITVRYVAAITTHALGVPIVESSLPAMAATLTDEQIEETASYLRERNPEFAADEAILWGAREHRAQED